MLRLQRNIYALYLIKLSKWFMLIMPIIALYYTENGLDEFDIFLLQAIYSVSVAVLEIPSGYMADFIGRKKSLVIGSVLGAMGYALYSCSSDFYGFLLAEMVLGIGGSFISGSDSALLYDTLVCLRRQHTYLRLEGRITSLGNFAETLAAVGGGMLAALAGYRSVYIGQTLVAMVAIPAALMLVEPERVKSSVAPGIRHILKVCHESIFVDLRLSSTLVLSGIIGTCTLCMAWTAQVYFVEVGLNERAITPLWVGLNLTVGIFAAFASEVVTVLGKRRALFFLALFSPFAYILLGLLSFWPAMAVLFLFYAVRGYATPLLKDMVNGYCAPEIRATVLSIRNMMIRIGFGLLGPALGGASVHWGLSQALCLAGVLLLIFSCLSLWYTLTMCAGDLKQS